MFCHLTSTVFGHEAKAGTQTQKQLMAFIRRVPEIAKNRLLASSSLSVNLSSPTGRIYHDI